MLQRWLRRRHPAPDMTPTRREMDRVEQQAADLRRVVEQLRSQMTAPRKRET